MHNPLSHGARIIVIARAAERLKIAGLVAGAFVLGFTLSLLGLDDGPGSDAGEDYERRWS